MRPKRNVGTRKRETNFEKSQDIVFTRLQTTVRVGCVLQFDDTVEIEVRAIEKGKVSLQITAPDFIEITKHRVGEEHKKH